MEIMRRSTGLRYNHYEDPDKCYGGEGWSQIALANFLRFQEHHEVKNCKDISQSCGSEDRH